MCLSAGHTCIPTHRKDSLDGEEAVCIHDFEGIDRGVGRRMLYIKYSFLYFSNKRAEFLIDTIMEENITR